MQDEFDRDEGAGKDAGLPPPKTEVTSVAATPPSSPPKSPFGSTASVPDFLSSHKTSSTASAPADSGTSAKPSAPFGSGPFGSSSASSFFGAKAGTGAGDGISSSATSLFGTFGSGGGSVKAFEVTKDKEKEKGSTTSVTTNLFGSSPTPPSNPFSIPDKPSQTNPFALGGSSAATPTSGFAGFGSGKSGTFGNPVGFAFGSPPPKPHDGYDVGAGGTAAIGSAFSNPSASTGFGGSSFGGFGVPPSMPSPASTPKPSTTPAPGEDDGSVGGSQQDELDPEGEGDDSKLPTKTHDQEGEGEEDEDTTHTTKSKVYKLVKEEDGKSGWRELGIGVFLFYRLILILTADTTLVDRYVTPQET